MHFIHSPTREIQIYFCSCVANFKQKGLQLLIQMLIGCLLWEGLNVLYRNFQVACQNSVHASVFGIICQQVTGKQRFNDICSVNYCLPTVHSKNTARQHLSAHQHTLFQSNLPLLNPRPQHKLSLNPRPLLSTLRLNPRPQFQPSHPLYLPIIS